MEREHVRRRTTLKPHSVCETLFRAKKVAELSNPSSLPERHPARTLSDRPN